MKHFLSDDTTQDATQAFAEMKISNVWAVKKKGALSYCLSLHFIFQIHRTLCKDSQYDNAFVFGRRRNPTVFFQKLKFSFLSYKSTNGLGDKLTEAQELGVPILTSDIYNSAIS